MTHMAAKKSKFKVIFSLFLVFAINSCTTMSDYDFSKIDSNLERGKYTEVSSELEKYKNRIYASRGELLYLLDTGILQHFSGETAESNKNLSEAEKLIEKYAAVSVMQNIASFASNDMAMDYSGEEFEDIYTNVFMSLNYVREKNLEDAMVEIRRFDNKLKLMKSKYEKQVAAANKNDAGVTVEKVSVQFSDSAFARYLSMILYRTDGDISNAEVDLRFLKEAFQSQSGIYNFAVPSFIDEELDVPRDKARLDVLGFYGKAPVKVENITRVYIPELSIWYKLSLPQMVRRTSAVTAISVTAKSISTGKSYTRRLEKLESIENIAIDTFQQRLSIVKAKSIGRALTRAASNAFLDAGANVTEKDDPGLSALFTIIGLASKIHTEAVEKADTRSARYFPGNVAVSGMTLEPGDYEVTMQFFSGNTPFKTTSQTISLKSGALNLIEGECFW